MELNSYYKEGIINATLVLQNILTVLTLLKQKIKFIDFPKL